MNGKNAIFDSNIIIYLSKRELDLSVIDQFDHLSISIITYMEILGYQFNDSTEEQFIKDLISIFEIVFIDQKIADLTVGIRKKKRIKLPDAIIAATAISKDACLVTRNVDDFKLTEAHMFNPFSH